MAANQQRTGSDAFSLIEVVVAVAVFTTSIVAILGLMGHANRGVENLSDAATANTLFHSIEEELRRIGFEAAADAASTLDPIELVATIDGSHVRLLEDPDGAGPETVSANNQLDDDTLPGIAERDRYFLIQIFERDGNLQHIDDISAFLALRIDVTWPFQAAVGPASGTTFATGISADPFLDVPAFERRYVAFNLALTP